MYAMRTSRLYAGIAGRIAHEASRRQHRWPVHWSPKEKDMSPERAGGMPLPAQTATRRSVLRGAGAGAVAAGAGGVLSACSSGIKGAGGSASTREIRIGFVTPMTGPLAGFASGDKFVLQAIRGSSAYSKGFKVGGKTYKASIVAMDSQSD